MKNQCSCHNVKGGPFVSSSQSSSGFAHGHQSSRRRPTLRFDPLRQRSKSARAASSDAGNSSNSYGATDFASLPENFCIIESRDAVKDFASLQLDEITNCIDARRNRIFLLMEEVRRLRIQQRVKGGDSPEPYTEPEKETYLSALPFVPPLTDRTLNTYYTLYAGFFAAVIVFGGLLAPLLEVRMGLGGTSYLDFVQSVHLPAQLAGVDPIVASFCGGAVGVVSALLIVEVSNVKKQQASHCHYCEGTGYLSCGNCMGRGTDPTAALAAGGSGGGGGGGGGGQCSCCAGTGKVMCTGCLCTGKQMATEHDPRIDPFQ